MPPTPQIFVDFDGTISRNDTTDLILEQFADHRWIDVETAWQQGEIGSRECMAAQVALLRVTPEAFNLAVRRIEIDPGFAAFLQVCEDVSMPVVILSDVLDLVADAVLHHAGVKLPVFSNQLNWVGGDRWSLSFPHAKPDCASAAGNCKCSRMLSRRNQGGPRVLIGDGRSDYCGAAEADVVFAKGRLASYCQRKRIPHIPFEDFDDLLPNFLGWYSGALDDAGMPTHSLFPLGH